MASSKLTCDISTNKCAIQHKIWCSQRINDACPCMRKLAHARMRTFVRADVHVSVFQLGIFLRTLRPAHTILRPARLSSALPELFKKKKNYFSKLIFFIYLQNVIVFSDSRCKNACNCLRICAHVFINRPQNCAQTSFHSRAGLWPNFGRSRVSVPHLVIRALNCARFCVACAINCAQILVVRALDCVQFLLHPALLPT